MLGVSLGNVLPSGAAGVARIAELQSRARSEPIEYLTTLEDLKQAGFTLTRTALYRTYVFFLFQLVFLRIVAILHYSVARSDSQ